MGLRDLDLDKHTALRLPIKLTPLHTMSQHASDAQLYPVQRHAGASQYCLLSHIVERPSLPHANKSAKQQQNTVQRMNAWATLSDHDQGLSANFTINSNAVYVRGFLRGPFSRTRLAPEVVELTRKAVGQENVPKMEPS